MKPLYCIETFTDREFDEIRKKLESISSVAYFNWYLDNYKNQISFYAYIPCVEELMGMEDLYPDKKLDIVYKKGNDGGIIGHIKKCVEGLK